MFYIADSQKRQLSFAAENVRIFFQLNTCIPPYFYATCSISWLHGKSTRDKDLEALRRKISDLEASMDRVNDRLDEMDVKLKERNQNMKVNVIRVVYVIKNGLILCTVRRLRRVF